MWGLGGEERNVGNDKIVGKGGMLCGKLGKWLLGMGF